MRRKNTARRGFSLIEVMVAAALLGLSIASITVIWGLSRRTTEQMRDAAEYYAISRQEVEREKGVSFQNQYVSSSGKFLSVNPNRSDYDASGKLLATNLSGSAAATAGSYYRAVSTFYLVTTGNEQDARKLGVQKVQILALGSNGYANAPVVYETTSFSSARSDWR